MSNVTIHCADCVDWLERHVGIVAPFDLCFLDPPFNQGKEYREHDDSMPPADYWHWMSHVCRLIYDLTDEGGAIYFMHREKKAEELLKALRISGWTLQNLIIWKKKTSAIPSPLRYSKAFQVIAFATKGNRPKTFHRLRINPPQPLGYRPRKNGMLTTDVWDDIRELTSGYFAGNEPLRLPLGERVHKQQSPIALLLRIILTSSHVGDRILDPFAGTGTTLVTASQTCRTCVGLEIDQVNVDHISKRLDSLRNADSITRWLDDYQHTENFEKISGLSAHVDRVPVFRLLDALAV